MTDVPTISRPGLLSADDVARVERMAARYRLPVLRRLLADYAALRLVGDAAYHQAPASWRRELSEALRAAGYPHV